MSVDNNNFGRLRFGDSTTAVMYGNVTVDGGRIGGGRAMAREDERWNVTVEVRASGGLLRASGNFSGDLSEGLVEHRSYAKLVVRVRVMKVVHRKKSAFMNCTMHLNLRTQQIKHLRCR
ncbi:hypothetical protein Acr_18g0010690 [Actinidia rufa]|uniref:Late embryogenesis abundant (LEA) hydroxyproline-rich glycoprotein family n=1 Tax=Actinidia rufa TaxID=165716 RepID=A0A7J0G7Z1_9ERIC|nr:hypothetical protein Acr_18g0010690 [Actinidia rufa]